MNDPQWEVVRCVPVNKTTDASATYLRAYRTAKNYNSNAADEIAEKSLRAFDCACLVNRVTGEIKPI